MRLITNDSVEEVILERAHQKLDIDGKVIQAGKFDNKSTAEEQEEFLKRLLEEEQTREEDADDNFLDEEELNDILARNEDEKELFESIDDNQKILDKQQGIKLRLIEDLELPLIFTEDITKHFEEEKAELGRVREKKRVKYDDGLLEEQWLMAIDDDNDTIEDAIKRNEARKRKRVEGEPAVILEEISELVADDGHAVSEVFEKLPLKKLYPDYYTVITQPVALETIRKKVKQGHATAAEVVADLKVMVANARTYNDEGLWVWDDADAVQLVIDRHDK